jgi:hypothetical protein
LPPLWPKHERSIAGAGKTRLAENVLRRQVEDIEEEYADDEEYEEATLEAIDSASRVLHEPSPLEKTLLRDLKEYALAASMRPDSKAKRLIDWPNPTLKPSGQWNDERVLIFTE